MAESGDADFLSVHLANNPSIGSKRKVTFTERIEVENVEGTTEVVRNEPEQAECQEEVPSLFFNIPLWDYEASEGRVSRSSFVYIAGSHVTSRRPC